MTRVTEWERHVLDKLPPCDPSWPAESVAAWLTMFDRVLRMTRVRRRVTISSRRTDQPAAPRQEGT